MKHLPKKICKYREVTDRNLECLANNTVWLSSPLAFNDPFDSAFRISHIREELVESTLKTSLDRGLLTEKDIEKCRKTDDPALTAILLSSKKQGVFDRNNVDVDGIARSYSETRESVTRWFERREIDFIKDKYRVCSFSTNPFSVVMWAHYTSNHSGYCIEWPVVDALKDNDFEHKLLPIIYSHSLLNVDPQIKRAAEKGDSSEQTAIDLLGASLIKQREWKYEQEWRLVLIRKEDESNFYPMPFAPQAIYLGLNISPENEEKIRCVADKITVPVKELRISHKDLSIEVGHTFTGSMGGVNGRMVYSVRSVPMYVPNTHLSSGPLRYRQVSVKTKTKKTLG